MKNLTLATLLIGLSATALSAAVDMSKLPADLQSKVRAAEQSATATENKVAQFVDDSNKSLKDFYTQLNQLLEQNGYLKGNPVTIIVQDKLKEMNTNLKDPSFNSAKNLADTISSDIVGVPLLLDYLKTVSPSDTFPDACKNFQGTKVTGIVIKSSGSRGFSFLPEPYDEKISYSFIGGVGLIGSGAEYVVSYTPNSRVQDAYLVTMPDTGGQQMVACLSNPYPLPPTAPTSGTTKK